MKKLLLAAMAALMVSVLSVTASAAGETASPETTEPDCHYVDSSVKEALGSVDLFELDYDTRVQILRDAYISAGWTEQEADISLQSEDIDPETLELAYMDIDEADPELREKILAARKTVIYNHDWVNDELDGFVMFSFNAETQQFYIPPKFSELFPGWDVPESETAGESTPSVSAEPEQEPKAVADGGDSFVSDVQDAVLSAAKITGSLICGFRGRI